MQKQTRFYWKTSFDDCIPQSLISLKSWFIMLSLIFVASLGYSQFKVSGVVTGAGDNQPIPGVSIAVKGTNVGNVTDVDGKYALDAPDPNVTLVFSFIGFTTQEVALAGQKNLDVVLQLSDVVIGDVVIIGYGSVKKDDLTGSVSVVGSEELTKSSAATLDRALQGRTSGVTIMQTSGKPGSGNTVKIRGVGSINMESEPLYVIDGVVTGGMNAVNPSDIESIQILKDASATAIYGARGANGVVLITTKRGKADKLEVSFSSYWSRTSTPKLIEVMNADQYASVMRESYDNYYTQEKTKRDTTVVKIYQDYYRDSVAGVLNGGELINTDWQKLITRPGFGQNYNLSLSGGTQKASFSVSGNWYSESGVLKSTGFNRTTFRANSDFTPVKWLKIGETFIYSRTNEDNQQGYNGNPWQIATVASPLMMPYDPDNLGGYGSMEVWKTGKNERTNPLAELELNDPSARGTRFLANLFTEIEFIKGLRYKLNFGTDFSMGHNRTWRPQYELAGIRDNFSPSLYESHSEFRMFLVENLLSYTNSFAGHSFTALVGHTTQQELATGFSATGEGFDDPNLNVMSQAQRRTNVSGYDTRHNIESFLGRVLYDYKGRYLVTASVRQDGSSRFSPGQKTGLFPSFSLGWKMNEDLFKSVKQINMMKLRFGWGKTGNENIGNYLYEDLLDAPNRQHYIFGTPQTLYYGASVCNSAAATSIKWEASSMTNAGLDLNLFDNRIQFIAEYFVKKQDSMLVRQPVSFVLGRNADGGQPWVNAGQVKNSGVEFNLIYKNKLGDFEYAVNTNFSYIKNKVVYLPNGIPITKGMTKTEEGGTIGAFYGFVAEGVFQNQEEIDKHADQTGNTQPGDLKFKDIDGDNVITDGDRTIIGSPIPKYIYGFNVDLNYKNFDFTIFLQGMAGFQLYNQQRGGIELGTDQNGKDENKTLALYENYWKPDRPSSEYTRLYPTDPNLNARTSSWWCENGSFLRIKAIQLGYSLPEKVTKILSVNRARFYGSASNVFTFTKYKGYDPEVSSSDVLASGIDGGSYPSPRVIMFGVQIDF